MLIEAAVGVSLGWLWEKLADAAEYQDNKNTIKQALEESIAHSYRQFQEKHKEFSESFFNQKFLELHVCPEILKFLTRHQAPNIAAVIGAFPDYVIFASENAFQEEIKEFFGLVMESMKSHVTLQEIIDRRQIEETNQITKNIQEKQKATNKILEQGFEEISLEQEQVNTKLNHLSSQNTVILNALSNIATSLPDTKGNELNKLITNQLDRARDLIIDNHTNDAFELLKSLESAVSTSDDYTRYRWHTNTGACYLALNQVGEAAEQYLAAYNFAKNEEKAVANRIRAYLLIKNLDLGLEASKNALNTFPKSGIIWAMHIKVKHLLEGNFDDSLIPEELQNDGAVLLIKADLKLTEKDFEESYNLAEKAFDQDKSSLDAKRAILIAALSWVTSDTVKSYYGQIRPVQREALEYAVHSFDDITKLLRNIQNQPVFVEIAHNLAVAAELLGDQDTKKNITTYALSLYPEENVFIRFKVRGLEESDDIGSIRKLTDGILNDLEKSILFLLAEISANKGNLEWNKTVISYLNARVVEKEELDELLGLKVCALWRSGNKPRAMSLAKDSLAQIMASPSLLSFYIRMLDEYGEKAECEHLLLSCSHLPEYSSSRDILQFADLLYDFAKYYEAANLYSKLIELPANDYLTKRYLNSLIKSDQRAKAISVLGMLPKAMRELSFFRRSEANLARASRDLETLENLLKQELQIFPEDSYVAAGYIATLYRRDKMEDLHNYLAQNTLFTPIIEANEIEIAKYQMELGFEDMAIFRIYSLFRSHPNSSEIAGYYFLMLLHTKKAEPLKSIEKVAPGTVVYLENDKYKKVIVIEPSHLLKTKGWPECISEHDELAKKLLGHRINDLVEILIGIETIKAKIIDIKSMFAFALDIAHKVIADSASSVGPVWSVNVIKSNGEFDLDPILESLKSRRHQAGRVLNVYKENKVPLQIIANALGIDIVTLMLGWPCEDYDLFVGAGTHEEREKTRQLINQGSKPYVIDITALIELNRLGLLIEAVKVLGKPLVTTSLREQLLGLIQIQKNMSPDGFVTEIDGKINYQEVSEAYLKERRNFLNALLRFVDDHCEVTPVVGPIAVTEEQTSIGKLLDYSSHDVIYLALERDAILVSEDGCFRFLAESIGVTSNTSLQPLLMVLRDRGIISEDQYSKHILDKLNRHHDFISITADDLLWAAKLCPNSISPIIESAIQTFKKPSLDLISGVRVGSLFLNLITKCVSPDTLFKYYRLILACLSFERKDYLDGIHESLCAHIAIALSKIKEKKAKLIIQKFGDKLEGSLQSTFKLKPSVQAIRQALSKQYNKNLLPQTFVSNK